ISVLYISSFPCSIFRHIIGFVSKGKEQLLLKDKMPGNILLRFNENHLGGITFSWVDHSENDIQSLLFIHVKLVLSLLSALPFADIFRDYEVIMAENIPENPLKYLYPDIPKDEDFSKHYSSQSCRGWISPWPWEPLSHGSFGFLLLKAGVPHSSSDLLPTSPGVYAVLRVPQQLKMQYVSFLSVAVKGISGEAKMVCESKGVKICLRLDSHPLRYLTGCFR
uniref:SH2 domain-containing protein n=1 Tax=Monodon monoceros TaxID=40151 RepID=A0A8C6CA44_MONMO